MPVIGGGGIGDVGRALGIDRIRRTSDKSKTEAASTGTGAQAPDDVEVSAEAKALLDARSAPDIRQEKVAALKQVIADGTYEVSSHALAERLIDAGVV